MTAADPDTLITEFFRRLDELEALAHQVTGRLTHGRTEPLPERQFKMVLICTGNRVRSPIAAGFLRMMTAGLPVEISSVGVLDLGPVPPLPEAIETAAALGLDISEHQARCVLAEDLSGVDLVLGFERRHVATAVVEAKAPRERSFAILELAHLLERVSAPKTLGPAERARHAVARAHAQRRRDVEPEELADPLGGTLDVYRDTISRVRELSERIAAGLFGDDQIQRLPPVAPSGDEPRRRLIPRLARGRA